MSAGRAGVGSWLLLGTAAVALVAGRSRRRALPARMPRAHEPPPLAHIEASRRFNTSSSLLALSVLADSGVEHCRGSFQNRAMYVPLASAALSLLAGVHGTRDHRPARHPVRYGIYGTAIAAALAGTGFHLYNVTKRPGHWSWHNLFYAAPLGAPNALLLSGVLGAVGERLRDQPASEPRLLGLAAGRALAWIVAVGLAGTAGEAGLLHLRGAFQHPAMVAPVLLPPVGAVLLAQAARGASVERPRTRRWLRLTAWLGLLGSAFHARGVARCHGGWRNWRQNLLGGPPLPAPPSFTALALAGLAALRLRRTEP